MFNAVDVNFFKPVAIKRSGLLFVGRNVDRKGIDVILKSAKANTDILHRIVSNNIPRVIRNLSNVEVYENISRLKLLNLYQKSKAIVLPSKCGEGMPLVLLEALACGTPAIVTKVTGNSELINSKVGKVIQNITAHKIKVAFKELEKHNLEKNCVMRARKFSLANLTKNISELYYAAYTRTI